MYIQTIVDYVYKKLDNYGIQSNLNTYVHIYSAVNYIGIWYASQTTLIGCMRSTSLPRCQINQIEQNYSAADDHVP